MNVPKVTIMIPTYNQSKYIGQALESALNQDYPNLEIVISDDCSIDETKNILSKYLSDQRVFYYKNKKNLGRVANYHKLLYEYATGDWVINLDGDDYFYKPDYISKAVELASMDDKIAFIFGDKILFHENKNKYYLETNLNLSTFIDGNKLFLDFPIKKIRLPHLSILYSRKKAMETGFYIKDITSSDWESFLRLMINNKIGYTKKIAGVWRLHEANESKKIDYKEFIRNLQIVDSVSKFAEKSAIFSSSQLKKWEEDMLFRMAKGGLSKLLEHKEYRGLVSFFKEVNQMSKKTFYSLITDLMTIAEIAISINKPLFKKISNFKKKEYRIHKSN